MRRAFTIDLRYRFNARLTGTMNCRVEADEETPGNDLISLVLKHQKIDPDALLEAKVTPLDPLPVARARSVPWWKFWVWARR